MNANKTTPRVSVLLPVYNGETTLRRAARSILSQTFSELELLILDDGSADSSARIADEIRHQDPRTLVVRNPRNLGLSATLNRGIEIARAPLIARMDADDVALPHRLETQVDFLDRYPEIDVLGAGAVMVDQAGRTLGIRRRRETHEEMYRKAFVENPFIHPTVVMRREFAQVLSGYDENLGYPGDYDLWLRGIGKFRYHNLPEPLIQYEVPESFTASAILSGMGVLIRNGIGSRRPLAGCWGASRRLVAYALHRLSLHDRRFTDLE